MTDEMTPERLAEIRARVKATTEGPWSFHPNHAFADPSDPLYVAGDGTVIADDISRKNNAVFIAHSRTDVPALIAEVERLREERNVAEARVCAVNTERDKILYDRDYWHRKVVENDLARHFNQTRNETKMEELAQIIYGYSELDKSDSRHLARDILSHFHITRKTKD